MKKILPVLMIVTLMVSAAGLSFAQDAAKAKSAMTAKPMEMKKDMKCCGMCPMHSGMMMKKSMVATPDGGVIVMACKKLMKYDKDLNLVKEAEMKIDMEKMMKECPMCKGMEERAGAAE